MSRILGSVLDLLQNQLPLSSVSDSDYDDQEAGDITENLPYLSLFHEAQPFNDPSIKRLLPGHRIHAKISSCTPDNTQQQNLHIYVIHLRHGDYQWDIKRHFKDFVLLHQRLLVLHTYLKVPHLTEKHKILSESFKSAAIPKVPAIPNILPELLKRDNSVKRKDALNLFLKEVLNIDGYRNYHRTLEFLAIGPLSFVEGLGSKYNEGFVEKQAGLYSETTSTNFLFKVLSFCCTFWQTRWLVIKDSFIAYINVDTGQVSQVLLIDQVFNVKTGLTEDGGFAHSLTIQNGSKKWELKCKNEQEVKDWFSELKHILRGPAASFSQPNEHGSFAPVRSLNQCRWIVDGATYFEAVATALDKAKEEIFITGWWVTPELYLKRPTIHGHYWQLDYILKRKAREGVRIFILLYKEVELALGINSFYSAERLSRLHENIKVLRHPITKLFFWAHHEKIVCVDQSYTFIGGLDLCYGRWDDYQHRLTDIGEKEDKIKIQRHLSTAALVHFNKGVHRAQSCPDKLSDSMHIKKDNLRSHSDSCIGSQTNLRTVTKEDVAAWAPLQIGPNKKFARHLKAKKKGVHYGQPEYGGSSAKGGSTSDGAVETASRPKSKKRGIKLFRNIANKVIVGQRFTNALLQAAEMRVEDLPAVADTHRIIQEMAIVHLGLERKFRIWHGKDYSNFIARDITNINEAYSDMINRFEMPRLPWHDIALFVEGAAARDIARHFIQRWNFTKEKLVQNDDTYPYLLPKSYANLEVIYPILSSEVGNMFLADCQVLRSLSQWSAGLEKNEHSIHEAYIATIKKAQHYIYIENQFFVTQPKGDRKVVNEINDALYDKIIEAHSENKTFRVYVVMPLLPAFEGEVGSGSGTVILAVTHWNYKSICRGKSSLLRRLAETIDDPAQYISFYGLRTHGTLNNKLVTELVYVHSKLMIVDDRYAIIGSANINDRSLVGLRDSEIAVLIHDTILVDSKMNGKPSQAGAFCSSLRKTLFREHLGVYQQVRIPVQDPVSHMFYDNVWKATALHNTEIYEKVFRCIPTNKVQNFQQLRMYQAEEPLATTDKQRATVLLRAVKGHLVCLPLDFLCKEKLTPSFATKEGYLPDALFT